MPARWHCSKEGTCSGTWNEVSFLESAMHPKARLPTMQQFCRRFLWVGKALRMPSSLVSGLRAGFST